MCPHHDDLLDEDESTILGSFCRALGQPIDSETYEAEHCSLFEVDPEKVQT